MKTSPAEPHGAITGGEVLVWLIEDNEYYRSAIRSVLEETGRFACPFDYASGEEALQALSVEIQPDLILLDIGLPGMSGLDAIGLIRAKAPRVHILILTVHDDDEKVFAAICQGASGYILKTSPADRIVSAIGEVMAGGAPMNPSIAKKVLGMLSQSVAPKNADYGLTERETEILRKLVDGFTQRQIAEKLFLSYHTVNAHVRNIYSKLQVHTRSGAVSKAYRERLL